MMRSSSSSLTDCTSNSSLISGTISRPARAEDVPYALRRCRVGRESAVDLVGQFDLGRVPMGHRHPAEGAVPFQQIDASPIGEIRHGQGRHLLKRTVEVHQHGEGGAGVGKEPGGLLALAKFPLGPPLLGHVPEDQDNTDHLARRVPDRRCGVVDGSLGSRPWQ